MKQLQGLLAFVETATTGSLAAAAERLQVTPAAVSKSLARLEEQLSDVASECVQRGQCVQIDPETGKVNASAIFSWREKEFAAGYADKAPAALANRSPIERAIVAFVYPKLLNAEKELVQKNTFEVAYKPFDWTLNDLTGRGGR